jgi:hypothetical protein
MKLASSFGLIALCFTMVLCQEFPECTKELLRTDDCADVINPAACYNQFRWNTRTLQCIDGANDSERRRKVRIVERNSRLENPQQMI